MIVLIVIDIIKSINTIFVEMIVFNKSNHESLMELMVKN